MAEMVKLTEILSQAFSNLRPNSKNKVAYMKCLFKRKKKGYQCLWRKM